MQRFKLIGWLFLAANLCSAQGPGVQRPHLVHSDVVQPRVLAEPAFVRWTGLEEEDALADWFLGETRVEILPNGGQDVLAVFREDEARIEIPVELTFRDTPRVAIDCIVRAEQGPLEALLIRNGEVLGKASAKVPGATETQRAVFTFSEVVGGELAVDRIALIFPANPLPLGLVAVEVQDMALGGTIPAAAFSGMAPVGMGTDARLATCFSTTADLICDFPVEGPGQRLTFSFATPKSALFAGPQPVLKLTLRAGDKAPAEMRFEFGADGGKRPRWQRASIDLNSYAGNQVRALFELEFDGDGERLAVLGQPHVARSLDEPASVLLVTSECHRSDHLGFVSEDGKLQTPTLDALARAGVAFVDATASSNGTLVSQRALFAGSSPAKRLGSSEAPNLAQQFASLGYVTLAILSNGTLGQTGTKLTAGFDRFSAPDPGTRRSVEQSLEQLHRWKVEFEGMPLFVWLQLSDALAPYAPPKATLGLYYPEGLNPYDPASPVSAFEFAPTWNPLIGDPFYTEALYDGAITHLDSQLTELFGQGRFARGVIAFTADHGESLRKGGEFRFGHGHLSWSTLAVPLIIKAPDLAAGNPRSMPVEQKDLGRTLLDLAGHASTSFPGTNLMKAAAGDNGPRFAMQSDLSFASVILGSWLLRLRLTADPLSQKHRASLFNLAADPDCRLDLVGNHRDTVRSLRELLVEWLASEARSAGPLPQRWLDPSCACAACDEFR